MRQPNSVVALVIFAVSLTALVAPTPVVGAEPTESTPAQDPLLKARLLAEVEGNLAQAAQVYRQLAESETLSELDRRRAWYGLGECLTQLGREAEARTAFESAATGNDELALRARAALAGKVTPQDRLDHHVAALIERLVTQRGNSFGEQAHADLTWIGEPAVPKIIDRLEAELSEVDVAKHLARLLLDIGGPEVTAYLRRLLERRDHFLVHLFASQLEELPEAQVPVWLDAFPFLVGEERRRIGKKLIGRVSFEQTIPLARDTDPELRQAALWHLEAHPDSFALPEVRELVLREINLTLRSNVSDRDAKRSAKRYFDLLTSVDLFRYPEARRAYLDYLKDPMHATERSPLISFPLTDPTLGLSPADGQRLSAAEVLEVAETWESAIENELEQPTRIVQALITTHKDHWTSDDAIAAVPLAKWGHSDLYAWAVELGAPYTLVLGEFSAAPFAVCLALRGKRPPAEAALTLLPQLELVDVAELFRKAPTARFVVAYVLVNSSAPAAESKAIELASDGQFMQVLCRVLEGRDGATPMIHKLLSANQGSSGPLLGLLAKRGEVPVDLLPDLHRRGVNIGDAMATAIDHAARAEGFRPASWAGPMTKALDDRTPAWLDVWRALARSRLSWTRDMPEFHATLLERGFDHPVEAVRSWVTGEALHNREATTFETRARVIERLLTHDRAALSNHLYTILDDVDLPLDLRQRVVRHVLETPRTDDIETVGEFQDSVSPIDLELLASLYRSDDPEILSAAVSALRTPFEPGQLPPLLVERFHDEDPEVRRLALRTAWRRHGDLANSAVIAALSDSDARVRSQAVGIIAEQPPAEAALPLVALLRDRDEEIRALAEQALATLEKFEQARDRWIERSRRAQLEAESAASALVGQMQPGNPDAVRLAAIRSAPALHKPELLPFLIELLRDSDRNIQAAAQESIDAIRAANAPR